jgi:hypothetical protein
MPSFTTPKGGVISSLLANIYLHYAIDLWLEKKHAGIAFERYADDAVIHCQSKREAEEMLKAIKERLSKFGLELSEEKTKIVYCKHGKYPDRKDEIKTFKFLGHDFKPQTAKNGKTGKKFLSYMATMSKAARVKISQTLKEYGIQRRTDLTLREIGEMISRKVQGWINYFEKYGRNELWHIFLGLNHRLIKWWKRKHKLESIYAAVEQIKKEQLNNLQWFAHWKAGYRI